MPPSLTILVNGAEETVPPGTTVRQLVERHKLSVDKVAVELNKRLVRTATGGYDRPLQQGDQLEIVTFVGGG